MSLFTIALAAKRGALAAKATLVCAVSALTLFTGSPARAAGEAFIVNDSSGLVLDVVGARTNSGQPVILFPRNNNNNQIFERQYVDGRYFKLVALHSRKCLDVVHASKENGAQVIQWDCHGLDNQLWETRWVQSTHPRGAFFPTTMLLVAKHSGKCLDAGNGKFPAPPPSDAVMQQWTCARNTDEPFVVNQGFSIDVVAVPVVN